MPQATSFLDTINAILPWRWFVEETKESNALLTATPPSIHTTQLLEATDLVTPSKPSTLFQEPDKVSYTSTGTFKVTRNICFSPGALYSSKLLKKRQKGLSLVKKQVSRYNVAN